MKKVLLSLVIVFTIGQMVAQKSTAWHKITQEAVSKLQRVRANVNTEDELYFTINTSAVKQALLNATDKFSNAAGISIYFPNKKGEMEQFKVWENSNMEPGFQAQFPDIRAYVGKGVTDKGAVVNFSLSPQGIQTILFRTDGATECIEAYDKNATAYVLFDASYSKKGALNCSTTKGSSVLEEVNEFRLNQNIAKSDNAKYKTLRLALSCTAEYATHFGASINGTSADMALVLAAMNATMTRVNGVYEKDLAVHLNMIDNSTFIYYNAATDPYSAVVGADNNGNGFDDGMDNWNLELMNTLHVVPGDALFDIGHLFGASGGGGNAGCIGCICSNSTTTTVDSFGITRPNSYKGSGITSPSNGQPSGDSFDIDFVAHEMGHQLGGNHSFTYGFESTVAQTEPGSGSTIMGYAGVTSYDVQAHSDPIFCYKNIYQIQNNLNNKTCPISTTMTTNATPVVNAGLDYTIPISTAFVLTGTASDADTGDVLTYLWEQNDVGTSSTVDASSFSISTKTAGPTFRTFKPSVNTMRYFPQMGKIISGLIAVTTGTTSNWESVSSVARTLNFTFTARDNHAGGGQTKTDATKITVNATGGPFTVTSQAAVGISYMGTSQQTVTWNVANTTAAPFNTPTVDILVSTNVSTSLETFNATTPTVQNATAWTTIASGVPNNGSYLVTLPDVPSTKTTCRFMVKAVGNVFLAVNAKNFTITPNLANESFSLDNFSLFPNPNNGKFTVQFDSVSSNTIEVAINDMRGRSVYQKQFENTGVFSQEIQMESIQAGIYLVTVKDGARKVVKKIVVN